MNGITLPCDILIQDIDKLSYADWLAVRRSGIGGQPSDFRPGSLPSSYGKKKFSARHSQKMTTTPCFGDVCWNR